jgi:diguanylate cyclase (GGDEF)-like protein
MLIYMHRTAGESLNAAQTKLTKLETHRRRVYQGVILLTAAIIAISWLFGEAEDAFITLSYPVFLVLLLLLGGIMGLRLITLDKLEILCFVVVGAMILSRLTWHFVYGDPLGEHLLLLAGGHYWAVGLLIAGSLISLGYQRGMIAAVATFAYSASLASYEVSACLMDAAQNCENWVYLLRIHLFLLVLLALTSAGTHMRERLISAFARAEMLEHRAETDALSGLANRFGAQRFLSREAALSDRYHQPMAIILIDVDHFKTINDEHGHEVGDQVIRDFARTISDTVREVDLAARWGGDEFLVAAPGIDRHAARYLAERFRDAISRSALAGIHLTMSVGIAEYEPGLGINDAISRADVMLYRAKAAGRNCAIVEPDDTVEPAVVQS